MSEEQALATDLQDRFALSEGALRVQRARRVWVEVPRERFAPIFDYLVREAGCRFLCTITGLDEGTDLGFIYHLARLSGVVVNVKTRCPKGESMKSITPYFPGGGIYERETVDLFGARFEGLPPGPRYPLPDDWPKDEHPLLKDWQPSQRTAQPSQQTAQPSPAAAQPSPPAAPPDSPPAGRPAADPKGVGCGDGGRIIRVPIGPQHPALKEPESFMVDLRGERIDAVNLRLGYNHRGIEKGCEARTYTQDLYLVERICGICSFSHQMAFVQAVEEIAGLQAPRRALYIRTLVAELERVHSHLLWLGVAGHEIGFDTLLMYTWRDREQVMTLLTQLTGNRVNYGLNTLGGVRRDISCGQAKGILRVVEALEERTRYYIDLARTEETLIRRLSGVGRLAKEDALALGAVGPTGRASGVDRDTRRDDPYLAYGELSFKVITDEHGDVYGRTVVRLGELMETYSMLRQLVGGLPEGPIAVKAPRRIPAGEALSRYEAPRGEDVHYVRADGSEKPERVKVRAPTLANTQVVARMLEDNYLADLPIVIAAIDPCFSCTDRTIAVRDRAREEPRTMGWEELARYSIDWHRQRGIDFSKIAVPGGRRA